eukprot:TRINITY_DN6834_c0_g1_i1.p1 TRINITY_DN6834_c0_g1~~TRINITY_DN6834_c0_g1_i1.p1  ORF type:complete len:492 (+),score=82.89 TRINITY_DN6834_c0_g1_i1:123-1598(+)
MESPTQPARAAANSTRRVSSSFIEYEGKILALKRSDKVKTYQQHWAVVSGSIEAGETPEACSRREIAEETGLAKGDIELIRTGRPLRVDATKEYNTVWIVFPFLYSLKCSPDKIKIDWEHTEYQFANLAELSPTVPNLLEAYERVTLNPLMQSLVRPVATNKTDGATALTKVALKAFKEFVFMYQRVSGRKSPSNSPVQERKAPAAGAPLTVEELSEQAKNFAWHLLHAREAMIHIGNLIARLNSVVFKNRNYTSVSLLQESVAASVDSLLKMLDVSSQRITLNIRQQLRSECAVLTHSFSGTVVQAISSSQLALRVYITESRTGGEGRVAALKLSQAPPESVASVTVIPDSAIGSIISSVDACLLGADSIFANGSFVNKTGSHLITMAAYNANVPVYVLCDSSKIRHRSQVPSEDAPESEFFDVNFSPDSNKNIHQQIESKRLNFFNPMFEITPKYENVKFISEAGIVSGSEITQLAKKIEDTWKYLEEG